MLSGCLISGIERLEALDLSGVFACEQQTWRDLSRQHEKSLFCTVQQIAQKTMAVPVARGVLEVAFFAGAISQNFRL